MEVYVSLMLYWKGINIWLSEKSVSYWFGDSIYGTKGVGVLIYAHIFRDSHGYIISIPAFNLNNLRYIFYSGRS